MFVQDVEHDAQLVTDNCLFKPLHCPSHVFSTLLMQLKLVSPRVLQIGGRQVYERQSFVRHRFCQSDLLCHLQRFITRYTNYRLCH